jgi:hypothetical protein
VPKYDHLSRVSEVDVTATSDIRSRGVSAFVAEWFDLLSEHVSVDRMTEYLAPDGMEMVFPDQTLHGVGDFRDWYAALGRSYTNQTHDVEKVLTTLSGDFVDVAIVVVWRGVDTSDGTRLVFRMRQNWRLRPIPAPPRFAMVRYRVDDMTAI